MMNLKKIAILGFAPCALLATGCYYREPADTIRTLSYAEAKEWVKTNYGEKSSGFVAPKSASSEWAFDGYISDFGKSSTGIDSYNYFITHTQNLLIAYSYCDAQTIINTKVDDSKLSFDEFAFKTNKTLINPGSVIFSSSNFTMPIRYSNFDDVLSGSFYSGITKYNCDYIVDDTNRTLTIKGTYNILVQVTEATYTGYHMLHIPDCSVEFNSKGNLSSIKFDITRDSEVRYTWYNSTKTTWSSSIASIFLKGSYIHFTYNY